MAYEFNGTNQYLSATAPIDGLTKPFTLACWFNQDNITSNGALIALSPASGNFWGIFARGAAAGDPVSLVHSSTAALNTTTGFSANTWTHACGVFESTLRTVYINGGSSASSSGALSSESAATNVHIGTRRLNGTLASYEDGRIAEVGIWSAALTAAEIASLAKGMTCDKIRPQSLVFYAPLVRDLQDLSGGLTITNNNAATVATHPRVYA
jgi:hypothetical protein